MTRPARTTLATLVLVALAALSATAARPAAAQDFMFRRPVVSIGFVAGYTAPRAEGAVFDLTFDEFVAPSPDSALVPLGRQDFRSAYLGGELGVRIGERWEISLGAGWARSTTPTESREWADAVTGEPLRQTLKVTQVPITLGARYYLSERGRSIGSFVWVPRRVAPYVGGGVGYLRYTFEQTGDFVDELDPALPIYTDFQTSSGGALAWYGAAGAELSLTRALFLNGEARYSWAEADAHGTYSEFGDDALDFSGPRFTLGISARF